MKQINLLGAPPPPVHAINRGIGIEGLGTMLAGLWGSGNGTNTFGENVGTIGTPLHFISAFNLYIYIYIHKKTKTRKNMFVNAL